MPEDVTHFVQLLGLLWVILGWVWGFRGFRVKGLGFGGLRGLGSLFVCGPSPLTVTPLNAFVLNGLL